MSLVVQEFRAPRALTGLFAGAALGLALSLASARAIAGNYPNLTPAVDAIRAQAAESGAKP